MKALIVGLGSIGKRHARNLDSIGVGVSGFDPVSEKRQELKEQVQNADVYDDLDKTINDNYDFSVIASPNIFHIEQAIACSNRNMDLFIEKPFAAGSDDVEKLVNILDTNKNILMTGSNWKFHPGLVHLKSILESGGIGTVLAVNAIGGQYLPDWHPWEDYRDMYSSKKELGGGVINDCHDLDYLTWLLGEIEEVSCNLTHTGTLDIETEDLACFNLRFTSGAIGVLQIDYLQRPYARRIHITGSEGTAVWDYSAHTVSFYSAKTGKWSNFQEPDNYDINQMYIDEMKHFIECVKERKLPLTSLEQSIHLLNVFTCSRISSENNGIFIKVVQ